MPTEHTGMFVLALCAAALCGYLLGSVNPAILISRVFYGKDVRQMGSGNAGMTNVLRNFGKKGAVVTLLCDVAKGALGVLSGRLWMFLLVPGTPFWGGASLYGAYVAAVFTVLGHVFPLYFGFKGGKGIATTLGVVIALQPVLAAVLLGIFLVVVLVSKMVSLGSVVAIILCTLSTLLWCTVGPGTAPVFCTGCMGVIMVLVLWMHRGNIKRIANGTEYKFGQKKDAPASPAAGDEAAS